MNVVLHGDYLGTKLHLAYDGDSYEWISCLDDEFLIFGSRNGPDLKECLDVAGIEIKSFEATPHGISIRSIVGDIQNVPWFHIMPKDHFKRLISELLDGLWGFTVENMGGYYINNVRSNRELLDRLKQPFVNQLMIKKISKRDRAADILNFSPKKGESVAPKTKYSQSGSITGRLTVTSGPNILTLKKDYRKIFMSRFKGGKIVQVDISSLEPRIALAVSGKKSPDDVYTHISNAVMSGSISRSDAKISVLSCIYGMGPKALGKILPDKINPREILTEVKRYFDINSLQSMLEDQIRSEGNIKNLYGRKIESGDALVNHFLQSTGVDVSFSVFESILDDLDALSTRYVPIYVIHDAILLDIAPGVMKTLAKVTEGGIYVEKLKCKFPVKIDIITEEK